jgi:1,2-dihydroxy-3-keto-5-methylthiopentene dioxygenase
VREDQRTMHRHDACLMVVGDDDLTRPLLLERSRAHATDQLAAIGVSLEHWGVCYRADRLATRGEVLETHATYIDSMSARGLAAVDLLRVRVEECERIDEDHAAAARRWLLAEVCHPDHEALLTIEGSARLCFRSAGRILVLAVRSGDLVTLPAGLHHWLDVGPRPGYGGLRFFPDVHDWVSEMTGDDVGERLAAWLDVHDAVPI